MPQLNLSELLAQLSTRFEAFSNAVQQDRMDAERKATARAAVETIDLLLTDDRLRDGGQHSGSGIDLRDMVRPPLAHAMEHAATGGVNHSKIRQDIRRVTEWITGTSA